MIALFTNNIYISSRGAAESRHIHVHGNDETGQALLLAVYDNLGKGASGAAVQNMNIMLGLDEATSLPVASL